MHGLFVDVLLPLAVNNLFTYKVPQVFAEEVAPGKRVIVPFGKQKVYSALIRNVKNHHENDFELKEIQSVLDDHPLVNNHQFAFWEWMSSYYMCTQGEVMHSALPAALKLESETMITVVENLVKPADLTENEEILLAALQERKEMSIGDIARLLKKSTIHQILKKAFEKKLIVFKEEIQERYKPKIETFLRFSAPYQSEDALEKLFADYESDTRKGKQVDTLMTFMKYLFEDPDRTAVNKKTLVSHDGISKSSVSTLISHGVLVEYDVVVNRIPPADDKLIAPLVMSPAQDQALAQLNESMSLHDVSLLYGVTSSGKTEIYIHLIDKAIKQGKQVLYLLPEIALTTQLIVRLQRYFGDKVGIYHSKYSSNERVEVWNNVLQFSSEEKRLKSQIVIGARSALFLPYSNLGLVIVDEEHDQSYKQSDPAPRYNGRDSAIMLAHIHQAKTVLGSATPSLETYHNAESGRFGLVKLAERHGGIQMPEIIVADVKEAKRKKMMKSHFTPELIAAMQSAMTSKEQIILFQNRRGFSNYIECKVCAWIPHCKNCSVTLTYHKQSNILKCHYCGFTENIPSACGNCGDYQLEVMGFGTEKIEEEIAIFFPDARIARMDIDSTRSKTSFQKIITDFEQRRIDILVGTQMITKGLDFDNVSTVGIINADQLINFPDFRSHERGYQLMAQVSGRSGRKNRRGKVIIQTQQPSHWVIRDVVNNDYEGFYKRDLEERLKFGYPPHSRLIEIVLRNRDSDFIHEASVTFTELLRGKLGSRVIGPHVPIVYKVRNLFYRTLLVKIEKSASPSEVKKIILNTVGEFYTDRSNLSVQIIPDVDPV